MLSPVAMIVASILTMILSAVLATVITDAHKNFFIIGLLLESPPRRAERVIVLPVDSSTQLLALGAATVYTEVASRKQRIAEYGALSRTPALPIPSLAAVSSRQEQP
jgi:hypothetical protein